MCNQTLDCPPSPIINQHGHISNIEIVFISILSFLIGIALMFIFERFIKHRIQNKYLRIQSKEELF